MLTLLAPPLMARELPLVTQNMSSSIILYIYSYKKLAVRISISEIPANKILAFVNIYSVNIKILAII